MDLFDLYDRNDPTDPTEFMECMLSDLLIDRLVSEGACQMSASVKSALLLVAVLEYGSIIVWVEGRWWPFVVVVEAGERVGEFVSVGAREIPTQSSGKSPDVGAGLPDKNPAKVCFMARLNTNTPTGT
mmetsp:Transcript_38069/g.80611  ORF Transcript_38069/g.80611 Transcript_38069/m.80611 type:complete len:128 (+) Transcript_38069:623-1006(+)